MTQVLSSLPPDQQSYSVSDFLDFGQYYGIDYRFPMLGSTPRRTLAQPAVVRGRVEEYELRPGLRLTCSDIDVLQHYESTSRQQSLLLIVVILEGTVQIRLGDGAVTLTQGSALSARFDDRHALRACQASGQRLRTLTLSLGQDAMATGLPLDAALTLPRVWLHPWQLPGSLNSALEDALAGAWPMPQRQWLLEGLALQLLAHGLPQGSACPARTPLAPQERQRLEAVRQLLDDTPAQPHTLQSLAEQAAMSPSSLRQKFHATYAQSVFDYLRDRRLALARDYLRQGYSVQQAAHFVGYRHATNFTTAFKRRYGIAPSALN